MLEALRDAFLNSEHVRVLALIVFYTNDVYVLQSYQRISRLHGHTEPVSCLAFTTDGDVLASGGCHISPNKYYLQNLTYQLRR